MKTSPGEAGATHVATAAALQEEDRLFGALETDLSRPVVVSQPLVLPVTGWCYHPHQSIKKISIVLDGVAHTVEHTGLVRRDVLEAQAPALDHAGHSLLSGFLAFLPVRPVEQPRSASLLLRAHLAEGGIRELAIGTIELLPPLPAQSDPLPPSAKTTEEPLVAICMATYNPPLDLFRIQVDSIIRQTHQNWICIINDDGSSSVVIDEVRRIVATDPRFVVHQNPSRLGFYYNFERCLTRVPAEADFVALCDQDDEWYPDKLSACLSAFRTETLLVYGDMDIVDRDGRVLSHTYWTTRRNNFTDFSSLLLANTVTGAASVFRASMLQDALPFPPRIGDSFHDHWLACVALARGRIDYVDRPLHAYRQHRVNVLGHFTPAPTRLLPPIGKILRWLRTPRAFKGEMRERLHRLDDVFSNDVVRISLIARTLQARLGNIPRRRRTEIARFAGIDHSLLRLAIEGLKYLLKRRPTLGAEWYCLKGSIGHRLLHSYYRRARPRLFRERLAATPEAHASLAAPAAPKLEVMNSVDALQLGLAPLSLSVSESHPRCVNLLIPTINFRYFFGGYIAMFNLALSLKRSGFRVRVVTVEPCTHDVAAWRRQIADYQGLANFFDEIDVATAFDRSTPLEVSPSDDFIATTWWTAHIAHRAVTDLGRARFLYLIQEYEPMTFPMGSHYALADASYDFPHCALFSTELLRDYFRQNRLGVFRNGVDQGETTSVAFQNAINSFRLDEGKLAGRSRRRLLFYARPELHAARNLFDLGVLALRQAVETTHFDLSHWKLHGIGSISQHATIKLGRRAELKLIPRTSLQEYADLLPTYDLGLALMLTPHPSLVPLDMAAAGLVTVTNTFATKTAEKLQAISSNLIAAPPTPEGISAALCAATLRVDDVPARIAGSHVRWATRWEDAFNSEVMFRLKGFLEMA